MKPMAKKDLEFAKHCIDGLHVVLTSCTKETEIYVVKKLIQKLIWVADESYAGEMAAAKLIDTLYLQINKLEQENSELRTELEELKANTDISANVR